jgi:hypothetical protein
MAKSVSPYLIAHVSTFLVCRHFLADILVQHSPDSVRMLAQRFRLVLRYVEPVTETSSPVEKPVAPKEQKKSGLMAKSVSPYLIGPVPGVDLDILVCRHFLADILVQHSPDSVRMLALEPQIQMAAHDHRMLHVRNVISTQNSQQTCN